MDGFFIQQFHHLGQDLFFVLGVNVDHIEFVVFFLRVLVTDYWHDLAECHTPLCVLQGDDPFC